MTSCQWRTEVDSWNVWARTLQSSPLVSIDWNTPPPSIIYIPRFKISTHLYVCVCVYVVCVCLHESEKGRKARRHVSDASLIQQSLHFWPEASSPILRATHTHIYIHTHTHTHTHARAHTYIKTSSLRSYLPHASSHLHVACHMHFITCICVW